MNRNILSKRRDFLLRTKHTLKSHLLVLLEGKSLFGLAIVPLKDVSSWGFSLNSISTEDPGVEVIYDIGSNIGEWTSLASRFFPKATFHLFEANESKVRLNTKVKFVEHKVLLSDRQRVVDYWTVDGTGDSYFREIGSRIYDENESRKTRAIDLDTYILSNGIDFPDLIKIDTQGSEFDILKGSPQVLERVKYIFIEVSFYDYNLDAPRCLEYIDYLTERGFLLKDIVEKHFVANRLWQVDFYFSRDK